MKKRFGKRLLAACLSVAVASTMIAGSALPAFAVQDTANNLDQPAQKGLWMTEIYQNDVSYRSDVYGNTSDQMEFVEITNTSDQTINFNQDYGFWYEYPSEDNYVMKQLAVTTVDGSSDVNIAPGQTVIFWSQRKDLGEGGYASEEEFRKDMNVPDGVPVFIVSGQNGFAENDRGFAIKKSTGETVSYYHYNKTTDEVTSDGLSVQLSIPDFGSTMNVYESKKPTTAGVVYTAQLNGQREIHIPENRKPEGLYLTEIRANDSNRDAVYGSGSNDLMECFELTNTTSQDIDLNKEYQIDYRIKTDNVKTLEITTMDKSKEGCIIPAGSTAVIWCYRADSLAGSYTTYPTEEEFRAAYSIPENVPVFIFENQNGLNNTLRGFEVYKTAENQDRELVSYYFWDGTNDMKDNKSVDLKINPDGPKMDVYKAQSTTNMGAINDAQVTYAEDDGSSPNLSLAVDPVTSVNQGDFIRIPYNYSGSDVMPVKSIELYYKTPDMDSYVCDKTTSFAIYNKWYAFIPSDVVLNADYVDYYVKAYNTYRYTMTDVQRVNVNKLDNVTGLRVNFGGDGSLSGTQSLSIKDFDNTTSSITATVDGAPVELIPSFENGAFFTFTHRGVDSYFKNALTCGDKIIKNFSKCSEIPSDSSMAIMVDQSYFTYNEDGSVSIELAIRAGTYGSTWESDTDANNDDFYISNMALSLTDGTVIQPTSVVGVNGNDLSTMGEIKMGDSADCEIAAIMDFEIPAGKVDAVSGMIDTTALSDGGHQLVVNSSSGNSKTIDFTVDNSTPQQPEETPVATDLDFSIESSTYPAVATVGSVEGAANTTIYQAKALNDISIYTGVGDSTAQAEAANGLGSVTSDNGQYPYQIFEITTDGTQQEQIRIDLSAQADYDQPIQLYALNTTDSTWDILETTEQNGKITAVFPLEDYLENGKVTVLAQARGEEYTPYTEPQATQDTVKNDYNWDGTGIPEQYDFSIAWISDTQYYSEQYMENFSKMTNWIVDNKDGLGIQYVVHTGDIVDEFNEEYQYVNASNELSKFEQAGLPYGLLGGNHDTGHGNERYELYDKYFGAERYEGNSWYGGTYDDNKGHYDLVNVDGEELLFIYMSWDIYTPEVDWINSVLEQYPDKKAIICTHPGINANAEPDYFSDLLLEQVCKTHTNVIAMLNGHYHGASMNNVGFDDNGDGVEDRVVYRICTDYQSAPGGGEGYIKMMYFDLANGKIYLNSYSPVLDDYNYYDTPKLDNYGSGVVASDIDIAELPVNFDRTTPKTLTVDSLNANLLTNNILGQGTEGQTQIELSTAKGQTDTAYAVAKDAEGNILSYSNALQYTVGTVQSTNKDILKKVVEYADNVKASDEFDNVIADVQKSFLEAFDQAKTILEDPTASQEQVDAAWKTLLNEIHKLGFVKGDITSLQMLVDIAKGYDLSQYIEAGQAELDTALTAAEELLANADNAMQQQITEAADNLLNAMMNLRFKADKSVLEQVVAEANGKDATAYTAESYNALTVAVQTATTVLENDNATQDEVDTTVNVVQQAIDNLVPVTTEDTTSKQPSQDETKEAVSTGQESQETKSANTTKKTVRTGDTGRNILYLMISGLSVATIGVLVGHKKRMSK